MSCCPGMNKKLKKAKSLATKVKAIATGHMYMVFGINEELGKIIQKHFQMRIYSKISDCKPCQHKEGGVCKICGCNIKAKTLLPAETCPRGKWGPEIPG